MRTHMGPGRHGFTLPEVLVAALVGLLVLAGVHRVFVAGLSTENTTSLQTEVNRKAQVAIDDIISRLRGGSLVLEGYTDSISFIDEDGNTVHYWLEGGRLLRNLEGGAPPPTVPLASDVSQLGFEYYVRRGEPATTAGEAGLVAVSLEVTRERHSCLLRSAVKLRNK